ncbi:hypothetical protein AC579_7781 [Pseudocercospora musae]|uniref:Uncharacterized protein n=1 Tax=Pseudocercospora musae TaxID=113226 RepID=A0A139IJU7_9PEZI|nr:hypothetical protein AC579_7781 [Pseudocercospora musae]
MDPRSSNNSWQRDFPFTTGHDLANIEAFENPFDRGPMISGTGADQTWFHDPQLFDSSTTSHIHTFYGDAAWATGAPTDRFPNEAGYTIDPRMCSHGTSQHSYEPAVHDRSQGLTMPATGKTQQWGFRHQIIRCNRRRQLDLRTLPQYRLLLRLVSDPRSRPPRLEEPTIAANQNASAVSSIRKTYDDTKLSTKNIDRVPSCVPTPTASTQLLACHAKTH